MTSETLRPLNLGIRTNNYLIFISTKIRIGETAKKFSRNKNFYSLQSLSELIEMAKTIYPEYDGESDDRLHIKIYDKINHKTKEFSIKIQPKPYDEHICVLEDYYFVFMSQPSVEDNKPNRYRCMVENYCSQTTDRKSFSFNSNLNQESLLTILKSHMTSIMETLPIDTIVFMNDRPVERTHRIIIYKSGNTESHIHTNSSSFTIKLPNYSSYEIINLIRGEPNAR